MSLTGAGRLAAAGARSLVRPPALLFLLLIATYAATACRTVGPGDSGELTVVMSTWGVAHAPGYPLLTLLGNLISHLPHPGEPAFLLNLLDGWLGALACAVLAAAVGLLTGRAWAGFAAGLALGTSRIFWQYALVVEVFSLNLLMGVLLLLFLARFLNGIEQARVALWPLPASALVMSTMVTHHPTLIVLAGPLLVLYAALVPRVVRLGVEPARLLRTVALSLGAALAGLLPLLYLPLAARHDPPLNAGNPLDLPALLRLVLRQDYGSGTLAVPAVVVNKLLEYGESAIPRGMRHFELFWADLPRSFGWVFPALPLLGLVWAARRARPLLLLTAVVLGTLALFFARVNTPLVPLYVGVTRPFYLLPQLILAFLGGLGIAQLMDWAGRARPRGAAVACALVAAGTGVALLPLHWRSVDQRANTFTRDLGANLVAGMPPRALVFSEGDLLRNGFSYQQACLHRRPDLALVHQPLMAAPWYVEELKRRRTLRLPDPSSLSPGEPAARTKTWLDLNLGAAEPPPRPIVAIHLIDDSYASAYRLVDMGLWAEVAPRRMRPDLEAWVDAYTGVVRQWALASLDRAYPETSWEAEAGALYTRALGHLKALRDVAGRLGRPARPRPEVPALALAERWQGRRRADYLAYQAEFWLACNADSLVPPAPETDSLLATTAMALARESLALDPDGLPGLRATAALMSAVPQLSDPRAEARIRGRIVQQRPGDLSELVPYFRVVVSLMNDPATRDPRLLEQAEADRRRYVAILGRASELWDNPALTRLRERWSAPLEGAGDPRLRASTGG